VVGGRSPAPSAAAFSDAAEVKVACLAVPRTQILRIEGATLRDHLGLARPALIKELVRIA
jgi:hypothetical protein